MKLSRLLLGLLVAPYAAIVIYNYRLGQHDGCVYFAAYLLAIIFIIPVLLVLGRFGILSVVNLCLTCLVLNMFYLMTGIPGMEWLSIKILLLYYTEIVLRYALSAVVFALVFWLFAYGFRYKVYDWRGSDLIQSSTDS